MQGTIRKIAAWAALSLVVLGINSCATKDPAPLIADPNAKKETALPWNEQQKWEREGEAGAMNQQRR
jgi:hypothetical protein